MGMKVYSGNSLIGDNFLRRLGDGRIVFHFRLVQLVNGIFTEYMQNKYCCNHQRQANGVFFNGTVFLMLNSGCCGNVPAHSFIYLYLNKWVIDHGMRTPVSP